MISSLSLQPTPKGPLMSLVRLMPILIAKDMARVGLIPRVRLIPVKEGDILKAAINRDIPRKAIHNRAIHNRVILNKVILHKVIPNKVIHHPGFHSRVTKDILPRAINRDQVNNKAVWVEWPTRLVVPPASPA